jgi:hypothetical protein
MPIQFLNVFKYLNSVAFLKHSFFMENRIPRASVLIGNAFHRALEEEPQYFIDLPTSYFHRRGN